MLATLVAAALASGPTNGPDAGPLPNPSLNRGQWADRLNIDLPPAPGGVVPEISLIADPTVREGHLGSGWSLELGGAISRHHGDAVPAWGSTSDDEYRIDGVALQVDSLLCYVPMWWDGSCFTFDAASNTWLRRQDGWRWTYGSADATWGIASGATPSLDDTAMWLLSSVESPTGQRIDYSYASTSVADRMDGAAQTIPRPERIRYGAAEVLFAWETRPDRRVDASLGALGVWESRLTAIEVLLDGQFYARYTLEYADEADYPGGLDCAGNATWPDPEPTQTLVRRVVREAASGERFGAGHKVLRCAVTNNEGESWDPEGEDLTAQIPRPLEAEAAAVSLGSNTNLWNRVEAVNLNGDGLPDLVVFSFICRTTETPDSNNPDESGLPTTTTCDAEAAAYLNTDASLVIPPFTAPHEPSFMLDSGWTQRLNGLVLEFGASNFAYTLADIDRDGLTDLLSGGLNCAADCAVDLTRFDRSAGTFSTTPVPGLTGPDLAASQLADLDGDGFPDLLTPAHDDPQANSVLVSGTWIRNAGVEGAWFDAAPADLPLPLETSSPSFVAPDGWDTSLCIDELPTEGAQTWEDPDAYRQSQAMFADFNNDGLLDVAYALYACWTVVAGESLPSRPFSRIFYGDGRGQFYDSGLSAGEPWLIGVDLPEYPVEHSHLTAGFAAALDVDRSGHMALLQYAGGAVMGGYDRGLDHGFFYDEPEDFDPGLDVLTGRYPWPRQTVFADFDGDGFADQLRFEEALSDLADYASPRTWSVTLHRAERTTAQGRLTALTGPWGGTTALTWDFTARWDDNPDLFINAEVIRGDEGKDGRQTYRFSEGFHDGERFRGFGRAQVRNGRGGLESYGYSVASPTLGSPIYAALYRDDDTLATLTVNIHGQAGNPGWLIPLTTPYFAPLLRQCRFEVGPGANGVQSEDVDSLTQDCLNWGLTPAPSLEEYVAAIGFEPNGSPGSVAANVADAVFGREPLPTYTFTGLGQRDSYGLEAPFPESEGRARGVATPHEFQLPAAPEAPASQGSSTTEVGFRVSEWRYDADRLLSTFTEHKDTRSTDDDLVTTYTWSGLDTAAFGRALEATVTTEHGGAQLQAVYRSSFLAGHFDLPQTVETCGRSSTFCLTTQLDYGATVTGEPASITHPDNSTESWTRDPACGLVTQHVDRVNRARILRYDALCRLDRERFQGGRVTTSYDALHRVSHVERDPDEADSSDTPEIIDVVRYDDPGLTLREATLRDDGRLELRELDEWGRPTFLTICEGEITSNDTAICIGAEQLVSATLWAEDGTIYAEVDPHFDGLESPVFHLFTPDALGRTVAESHPGHNGGQAVTTLELLPFETRTTDPLGRVHVTAEDPLTTSLFTNGLFRGSSTRDAWGLTLSTTDPDGRVIEVEYDDLHRPHIERLTSDPTLAPGDRGCVSRTATSPSESTCTPEWTHSYDVIARTHTVTDPQGIDTIETFDAADRLTRRTHDGAVVLRATWTDRNGSTPAKVAQIDESGARVLTKFDGFARPIYTSSVVGVATTAYTPDGWLEAEDEDGRASYAERDVFGRVRATCRNSGWTGSVCDAPLWEADYDGAGRVVWQADADGVETEVLYTDGGLPELVIRGPFVLLERLYDEAGRATWSFQDGVGHHLAYNDLDQPETLVLGDLSAPTVQYTYGWSEGGRLESVSAWPVAGTTATTTTTFDDFGWPKHITHPDGSAEALCYDALGRLRFREDERGNISSWRYDRRGREKERDLAGSPTQTTTYRSNRTIAGIPNLTEITTTLPEGIVAVDYIDSAGREIARVQPDGTTILNRYDGSERWATEHLSASGTPMAMQVTLYDEESGLPDTEWGWFDDPYAGTAPNRADFAVADPADYITTYEHSPAGRLRAVTTGDERTEFSYEDGYLSVETWDEVRERYVLREGASPLVTATIEIGSNGFSQRTTELARDGAGRVTSTTVTDPSGTLLHTREGLDALGNATTLRRILNGVEESREEWSYTLRGWPEGRTTVVNGATLSTLTFDWDDDGVLSSISGLRSGTLSYERSAWTNNDELVDAVRVDGARVAEVTGRDSALRATDLALSGVYDLSLAYDTMSRVTAQDAVSQDPAAFPSISRTAAYDERGRLDSESTSTADGARWSLHDYEEPGWLASTTSDAGTRAYTHDAGGRRVSSTLDGATEHTLGWDGSALTDVDGNTLTLDPFDAVIADDRGTTFTRDPSGALVELSRDTETAAFTRGPNGWPILTSDTSGTRVETWGFAQDSPLEVLGADGAVALNLNLGGLRLGQLRDGTPIGILEDARGALLQLGSEVLPDPGPFGEVATLPTLHEERHVFAGLEAIPGFDGLLLARHRELDTRTGAWLSPDPLGLGGGAHRQRYAEGDPLGFVDPLGLTATPILRGFGLSNPTPIGVWDGPTTIGSPGSGPGACTFSAKLCGGQQSGGARRFILRGDDDPGDEVDAGKSARKERRNERQDRRAAARVLRRNGEVSVFDGEVPDARGSHGVAITLTGQWTGPTRRPGLRTSAQAFRGRLSNAGMALKAALTGGELRGRVRDAVGGWWNRTFPEGSAGAQVGSAWRRAGVWLQARDATQLNYAADAVESAPTLLRFGGLSPLAGPAERALQRSGLVDAMRDHAAKEYRLALEADPEAAEAGADAGLLFAVLIDVAIPGPGGEAKAAGVALDALDDAAKGLAKASDELMETGARAAEDASDSLLTRVGRWMDPRELEAMKATGRVQPGGGGVSRVAVPADASAYKAAQPGDVFATYDVPTSSLRPAGTDGWRQMAGPDSIYGRLAEQKGLPPPELPKFQNLVVETTK